MRSFSAISRKTVGVLIAVAVVLPAAVLLPAAHAQSSNEKPKATEIGVTASEIHIAVIADVDTPLAPGLFKGMVDGAKAAAKYINSKAGGGGLAGRKLVVDFLDSKLNPNEARNAVITACAQDYAMVATSALFLTSMDDAVNCKDQAGKVTGLPDIPATGGGVEGCSSTSFPMSPPALECDTADQTPQTYQTNKGAFDYLASKNKDLHGAMVYSNDTKDGQIAGQVLIEAAKHANIKEDQNVGVSARAPQSAYTPIVQKMKSDGSNFAYSVSTASGAIQFMSEAKLQGISDPNMVWVCTISCYDKVVQTNADTEGVYVPMTFLPFDEASTNKTLAAFLANVGKDNATGFAVYGWTATLAFAEAVKAAVAKGGVNNLTRSSMLGGIKTLTAFDAGGMLGTTDIANKVYTSCNLLLQLQSGKWKRVWPSKKGTFNCAKSNRLVFKADLQGG